MTKVALDEIRVAYEEGYTHGLNVGKLTYKSAWISVKDKFPEYLEGKDYSANVLGICKLSETHSYMGIFSLIIVDYTEDGHLWAWAKLDRCYGDLHEGECEFDDGYEITHWMPLPDAPKESNDD